jgi:hypothetical protein
MLELQLLVTNNRIPKSRKQGFCVACGLVHDKCSQWYAAAVTVESNSVQLLAADRRVNLGDNDKEAAVASWLQSSRGSIVDLQQQVPGQVVYIQHAKYPTGVCSKRYQVCLWNSMAIRVIPLD